MIKPNEQFAAANRAAIDTLLTVASASLNNAERLAALNLNTARAFFADAAANLGAVMSAKDPQGLLALQGTLARPAVENAVAYSRNVYEILSDSGNGLTQIIEGQAAELKKNFSSAIEQSLTRAPAGSESVVAAVKSAMSQADSIYETISQSTKQARTVIETTFASASAATMQRMAKAA